MNKLPTKQSYLLIIIIVGIIALSIYSTYAIFTFEGSTSDIVSLYTPNSLKINVSSYEYKQLTVEPSSYITTDVDIYNTSDTSICYSLWYQAVGSTNKDLVQVLEHTSSKVSTSGTLDSIASTRKNLLIINDNDTPVKINIGVASTKNEGTCSLNITEDKSLINTTIKDYQELTNLINKETKEDSKEGYLIYKNNQEPLTINKDNFYVSSKFTYHEESFTLTDPIKLSAEDILKYQSTSDTEYYTCIDTRSCKYLYKINKIDTTTIKNELTNTDEDIYQITSYDTLKGYLNTTSGVRKVSLNNIDNYYYYGDNPHNFIYYNCTNSKDITTCELWRIIGTVYDNENESFLTKIIKDTPINSSTYSNSTYTWSTSDIKEYLNKEYKLSANVKEYPFKQENITDTHLTLSSGVSYLEESNKDKVLIMNLSDYLNASSCTNLSINNYSESCLKNNWLNNGVHSWTMTAHEVEKTIPSTSEENTNETIKITNEVFSVSDTIEPLKVNTSLSIRPVVYLNSRMLITSGTGTIEDPYIIK